MKTCFLLELRLQVAKKIDEKHPGKEEKKKRRRRARGRARGIECARSARHFCSEREGFPPGDAAPRRPRRGQNAPERTSSTREDAPAWRRGCERQKAGRKGERQGRARREYPKFTHRRPVERRKDKKAYSGSPRENLPSTRPSTLSSAYAAHSGKGALRPPLRFGPCPTCAAPASGRYDGGSEGKFSALRPQTKKAEQIRDGFLRP